MRRRAKEGRSRTAEDLVLYTNPQTRGRVTRWMLEETGKPYRTELLQADTTMKAPEYLAINPMGKVPALRHGKTVVTEWAGICLYLADAFPEAQLAPPVGDPLRGPYYRWILFAAGPVEAAVSDKMLGVVVPPEQQPAIGYGNFDRTMSVLERAVGDREYLVGDRFTTADVVVGSHIGFGLQFGHIDKRPAFERYWQCLAARPAAKRAREIDDGLIAQAQAAE
jgi:glutathione S-transferase